MKTINLESDVSPAESYLPELTSPISEAPPFLAPDIFYDETVTGAQRSAFSLGLLKFNSDVNGVRSATTHSFANLRWAPAQGMAIERDNAQQFWFSGHASAILSDGAVVIAASPTGGVWIVNPRPDEIPIANSHEAIPLSHDWRDPDVNCLAYAPGATDQFFAGCNGGSLYLVEMQVVVGGLEPKRVVSLPAPSFTGGVLQIAVLTNTRRIVLACRTGVYWSPVPKVPGDSSGYVWRQAAGLPLGAYNGLAEGPSDTVVAAAQGANVPTGLFGIFVGRWQNLNLVFSKVDPLKKMGGIDATRMLRTSLTSCDADRNFMYAVAAGANERIFAVLASSDGGSSWTAATVPDGGLQGSYTNCIAVSPFRKNVVVLGWTLSGPIFSINGGASWSSPHTGEDDQNLHADFHAMYFSRNQQGEDHLFAGNDGGVVVTRDLGRSFDSHYNKHLQTLQFYRGELSASSRFPGLIAGGTQDNGNIYCNSTIGRASWKTLEGGDGGPNRFIDALGALLRYNNTLKFPSGPEFGNRVRMAIWNQRTETFDPGTVPMDPSAGSVIPVDGEAGGLSVPILEVVTSPTFSLDGKLMYAVAAATQSRSAQSTLDTPNVGKVYGLFANRDGSDASFRLLADIAEVIGSLTSRDGRSVLIGTQNGRIVSLDCASRKVTSFAIPAPYAGSGNFMRMADLGPNRAFALHYNGGLLHYDGSRWKDTGRGGLAVFEADGRPGSRRVFAATDTSVLVSADDGATWADESSGLPACPHCSDLRLAADGKGGHDLYLATYGRSVWTAKADFVEPVPIPVRVPGEIAEILLGVLGDGGGLIEIGGQVFRIPPRAPAREILRILAIDFIAGSLSEGAAREIRIAAMKAVRDMAEAQIQELVEGH